MALGEVAPQTNARGEMTNDECPMNDKIRMIKAPAARMAATHAGKMPATRAAGPRFHQSRPSLTCRYIRHLRIRH